MLPLDPTQEAGKGGGIEETSHSPWIAIAVSYNTEVRGRYNAEAGEGATASNQGQQIIMGEGVDTMLGGRHNGRWELVPVMGKGGRSTKVKS